MVGTKILIVEDEPLMRQTLVKLLQSEPGFEIAASAASAEDGLELMAALKPDVVLMDLELPGISGIEATRRISEACPKPAVVVLTHLSDDESLFAALKAGAIGYVLKDATVPQIVAAVKAAQRGEGVIYPTLASSVIGEFRRLATRPSDQRELFQALSRREVEILERIGQRKRNREIADELCLSERTIKNHVTSILHKLHINSRAEAAEIATRHGLLD